MSFWFLYLLACLVLILILNKSNLLKPYYLFFLLIIFVTPSQITVSSNEFSPAIFNYIFSITLERNFSLRPLRPLLISLTTAVIFSILLQLLKRILSRKS